MNTNVIQDRSHIRDDDGQRTVGCLISSYDIKLIVPIIAAIIGAVVGVILGIYLSSDPGFDVRADPHVLYLYGPAEKEVKITVTNSHWFKKLDQQIALLRWEEGDPVKNESIPGLFIKFKPDGAPSIGDNLVSNMTIMATAGHKKNYRIIYSVLSSGGMEKTGIINVKVID